MFRIDYEVRTRAEEDILQKYADEIEEKAQRYQRDRNITAFMKQLNVLLDRPLTAEYPRRIHAIRLLRTAFDLTIIEARDIVDAFIAGNLEQHLGTTGFHYPNSEPTYITERFIDTGYDIEEEDDLPF